MCLAKKTSPLLLRTRTEHHFLKGRSMKHQKVSTVSLGEAGKLRQFASWCQHLLNLASSSALVSCEVPAPCTGWDLFISSFATEMAVLQTVLGNARAGVGLRLVCQHLLLEASARPLVYSLMGWLTCWCLLRSQNLRAHGSKNIMPGACIKPSNSPSVAFTMLGLDLPLKFTSFFKICCYLQLRLFSAVHSHSI